MANETEMTEAGEKKFQKPSMTIAAALTFGTVGLVYAAANIVHDATRSGDGTTFYRRGTYWRYPEPGEFPHPFHDGGLYTSGERLIECPITYAFKTTCYIAAVPTLLGLSFDAFGMALDAVDSRIKSHYRID